MSDGGQQDRARAAAAAAAVELLSPGMTVGFGSGRAVWAVMELAAERLAGGADLRVAVASERTDELAHSLGFEVIDLDGQTTLDLAIDGADEVDPGRGLIKGGGAALLREKLLVAAAERFVVVAETSKQVERLGETRRLPVEVVRFAWRDTRRRLLELVPAADVRENGDGAPLVTDEHHLLLDCELPPEGDLVELGRALNDTPGVVEHGLFIGMADTALLGTEEGEVLRLEAGSQAAD